MTENNQDYGELGQASLSDTTYNPRRLFAIPRAPKREALGINPQNLPFSGVDIWNHYEVSWLNAKGTPCVAMARIIYDCASPNLIESKSLKLYFNSLNQTSFESVAVLKSQIISDLSTCLGSDVMLEIIPSTDWNQRAIHTGFTGISVDALAVSCSEYTVNANLLKVADNMAEEVLCSDLLRSNCPVTNQPDWGSVQVSYQGPRIQPESFLKYIVSFRNHQGFHEQCIEQIFMDILTHCKPKYLTVYGRYTRRGGLDINPFRSTETVDWQDERLRLDLMRQ